MDDERQASLLRERNHSTANLKDFSGKIDQDKAALTPRRPCGVQRTDASVQATT